MDEELYPDDATQDAAPVVMKMQLSRPALERLIGDDAQLEFVIQDVAIKQVLGNRMAFVKTQIEAEAERMINEAFGKVVKTRGCTSKQLNETFQISTPARDAIWARVRDSAATDVHNFLVQHRSEYTKLIGEVIDEKLKSFITSETQRQVTKLVEAATKAAIAGLKAPDAA
jgi:hypothetical protein